MLKKEIKNTQQLEKEYQTITELMASAYGSWFTLLNLQWSLRIEDNTHQYISAPCFRSNELDVIKIDLEKLTEKGMTFEVEHHPIQLGAYEGTQQALVVSVTDYDSLKEHLEAIAQVRVKRERQSEENAQLALHFTNHMHNKDLSKKGYVDLCSLTASTTSVGEAQQTTSRIHIGNL